MITNILSRKSRPTAGLAFALLLVGLGLAAHAQPFPVGTWDLKLSHARKGTAYITFAGDGTISDGIQIHTPVPRSTNAVVTTPRTETFGGAFIGNGTWHFDQAARVVGFYTEVTGQRTIDCSTNENVTPIIIGTNIVGLLTNLTIICVTNEITQTNGISFVANGKPEKISITATLADGRTVFLKGVPATPLPDISGSYFGKGSKDGVLFNEFFTLNLADPSINLYDLEIEGAGYSYTGLALLSKKQISFYSTDEPVNQVLRALNGPINSSKGTATLKGLQGDANVVSSTTSGKILYLITRQPD